MPHKPSKKTSKTESMVLFLMGESPLLEEWADLSLSKGYEVFVHWNKGNAPSKKNYKQSNAVPAGTALALELTNTDIEQKKSNLQRIDKVLPKTAAIISSSVTTTASEQAGWITQRHRLVGFGALPGFSQRPLMEVAPTVHSPKETLEVVRRFFSSVGKEIELVQDRVGMVLPRVLCQIINEAVFALQEDVASPQDIDTAMKLGLNYPLGPIEWADRIGFRHVHAVLAALENDLKEDRYRIAPLLKQMAQTGEWWKQS